MQSQRGLGLTPQSTLPSLYLPQLLNPFSSHVGRLFLNYTYSEILSNSIYLGPTIFRASLKTLDLHFLIESTHLWLIFILHMRKLSRREVKYPSPLSSEQMVKPGLRFRFISLQSPSSIVS